MENSVQADIRRRKYTRLERTLALLVSGVIVLTGLVAAFFIFRYISERNAPPTTYYDYQLRIWRGRLESNPKSPVINANLGYIYLKMGDDSKGLFYLKRALDLDKKLVPALYNLGLYYKKHQRKKLAISYLTKAGENAPAGNKYLAYYSLGELYFEDKKYDQALEFLKKALEDNGTIWNTYEKIGRIYEIKGDKAQALENYKKALAFNPGKASLKAKVDKFTNGNAANN